MPATESEHVLDPVDQPAVHPVRDLTDETPFRRSLRASRERRAAAWRRRRNKLVGRRGAALAVAGLAVASGGAFAAQGTTSSVRPASPTLAIQRALHITADGVYGSATKRAVRAFQRAHGLTVDGIVGPQTLAALGIDVTAAYVAPTAGTSSLLTTIAQCESGGNPSAISAGGRYRGKYQFSRATWRALGGTGDPAKAPESVQDQLAAKLLASQGTRAWPVCGRGMRSTAPAPAAAPTAPAAAPSSTTASSGGASAG